LRQNLENVKKYCNRENLITSQNIALNADSSYRDYFRNKVRIVNTKHKGDLLLLFFSMLNFTIPPYSIAFAHEKAAAQQYSQM